LATEARSQSGRRGHRGNLYAFPTRRDAVSPIAVDRRLVCGLAANRLGDPCEPIREVRAASAPDVDALVLLECEDAEAVVLHLMQPSRPGGRGRRGSDQGLAAGRHIEGGMSAWTKAGGATH